MPDRLRRPKEREHILVRIKALPKPTPGQAIFIAVLVLLIGLSGARIWSLVSELREVRAARLDLEQKKVVLEKRHSDLEEQAAYITDKDNLEKELRSHFNYKKPGENVIVVVPPKGASTTTSTNE